MMERSDVTPMEAFHFLLIRLGGWMNQLFVARIASAARSDVT
jgi:hypothetical protein